MPLTVALAIVGWVAFVAACFVAMVHAGRR